MPRHVTAVEPWRLPRRGDLGLGNARTRHGELTWSAAMALVIKHKGLCAELTLCIGRGPGVPCEYRELDHYSAQAALAEAKRLVESGETDYARVIGRVYWYGRDPKGPGARAHWDLGGYDGADL